MRSGTWPYPRVRRIIHVMQGCVKRGAAPGGAASPVPYAIVIYIGGSHFCAFACPPLRFVLTSGRPLCYNNWCCAEEVIVVGVCVGRKPLWLVTAAQ